MSVVAIHPRTPASAGPSRAGSTRRRSPAAEAAPVIRVTIDIPLVGGRANPELSLLLGLVRDLLDRGADVVLDRDAAMVLDRGAESLLDRGADVLPEGRAAGHSGTEPSGLGGTGTGGPGVARIPAECPDPSRYGSADGDPATPRGGVPDPLVGPHAIDPVVTGPHDAQTLRVLTGPRLVFRDGLPISLTRLEFDLLAFLASNPRRVFTRMQLLSNVWGYQHAVARTVDVHVRRLRAKLGTAVPLVTTVYGVGYRLADNAVVHLDDVG